MVTDGQVTISASPFSLADRGPCNILAVSYTHLVCSSDVGCIMATLAEGTHHGLDALKVRVFWDVVLHFKIRRHNGIRKWLNLRMMTYVFDRRNNRKGIVLFSVSNYTGKR